MEIPVDNSSEIQTRKPILAVDVDDTTAHLMKAVAKFHNETYGEPHYHPEDYHTLEFHQIWVSIFSVYCYCHTVIIIFRF